MAFESWDDAMLWNGCMIGYTVGVKSACKDEDKSCLLLRMADTQARLKLMETENSKLREQMERLMTLLRNDWDIDVSWDGLRKFWSIELTEGGCLMRDRACRAEAENAKLRELVHELYEDQCDECDQWKYRDRMCELGIEV